MALLQVGLNEEEKAVLQQTQLLEELYENPCYTTTLRRLWSHHLSALNFRLEPNADADDIPLPRFTHMRRPESDPVRGGITRQELLRGKTYWNFDILDTSTGDIADVGPLLSSFGWNLSPSEQEARAKVSKCLRSGAKTHLNATINHHSTRGTTLTFTLK